MEEIGAHYISMASASFQELRARLGPVDLVLEATGSPQVPFALVPLLKANGVMALVSVPTGIREMVVDVAALIRGMVLSNQALLGSVNAGPSNFRAAVEYLALFKRLFGNAINKVVTHTYPLEQYREPILHPAPDGIKSVLELTS